MPRGPGRGGVTARARGAGTDRRALADRDVTAGRGVTADRGTFEDLGGGTDRNVLADRGVGTDLDDVTGFDGVADLSGVADPGVGTDLGGAMDPGAGTDLGTDLSGVADLDDDPAGTAGTAPDGGRDRRTLAGGGVFGVLGVLADSGGVADLGDGTDRSVVAVGFKMAPIPSTWPNTCRRKIGESNTMSIELPYDVVHHAGIDFEDIRTIV
ncbi:hypothetical protein [Streptosporangium sp. 'caverna']|uniref:hypothetical protein n=1 Tax=Streptosporangium sp. 'caverna' TaxID=2202249 RepID=UPI0013A69484|nr:hypothetical protein [Streptosporangium sp. 'caverna']